MGRRVGRDRSLLASLGVGPPSPLSKHRMEEGFPRNTARALLPGEPLNTKSARPVTSLRVPARPRTPWEGSHRRGSWVSGCGNAIKTQTFPRSNIARVMAEPVWTPLPGRQQKRKLPEPGAPPARPHPPPLGPGPRAGGPGARARARGAGPAGAARPRGPSGRAE